MPPVLRVAFSVAGLSSSAPAVRADSSHAPALRVRVAQQDILLAAAPCIPRVPRLPARQGAVPASHRVQVDPVAVPVLARVPEALPVPAA